MPKPEKLTLKQVGKNLTKVENNFTFGDKILPAGTVVIPVAVKHSTMETMAVHSNSLNTKVPSNFIWHLYRIVRLPNGVDVQMGSQDQKVFRKNQYFFIAGPLLNLISKIKLS